jgi:hypothetical protein
MFRGRNLAIPVSWTMASVAQQQHVDADVAATAVGDGRGAFEKRLDQLEAIGARKRQEAALMSTIAPSSEPMSTDFAESEKDDFCRVAPAGGHFATDGLLEMPADASSVDVGAQTDDGGVVSTAAIAGLPKQLDPFEQTSVFLQRFEEADVKLANATEFENSLKEAHKTEESARYGGGKTTEEKMLEEMLKTKKLTCRTPLDAKFRREYIGTAKKPADAAKKKLYDESDDQARFKVEWVSTKLEVCRRQRHDITSWQEVDITLGEYLSFGSIVQSLGGWEYQPAIDGAKRLCSKCLKLNGKWVVYEEFSELLFFLKLRVQHSSVFERKWCEYRTSIEECAGGASMGSGAGKRLPFPVGGNAAAAEDAASKGRAAEAATKAAAIEAAARAKEEEVARKKAEEDAKVPPRPKKKARGADTGALVDAAGATPTRKGSGKGADRGQEPGDVAGKSIPELLKEASKLKIQLTKVEKLAETLIASIKTDDGYKRFNNAENLKPLEEKFGLLKNAYGPFAREFMLQEPAYMEKNYEASRFKINLEGFLELTGPLGELHMLADDISRMHRA